MLNVNAYALSDEYWTVCAILVSDETRWTKQVGAAAVCRCCHWLMMMMLSFRSRFSVTFVVRINFCTTGFFECARRRRKCVNKLKPYWAVTARRNRQKKYQFIDSAFEYYWIRRDGNMRLRRLSNTIGHFRSNTKTLYTNRLVSSNTTVAHFISINMFCVVFILNENIRFEMINFYCWLTTVRRRFKQYIHREEQNSFGTLKDEKRRKKILSFDGDDDKYHASSERQTERERRREKRPSRKSNFNFELYFLTSGALSSFTSLTRLLRIFLLLLSALWRFFYYYSKINT